MGYLTIPCFIGREGRGEERGAGGWGGCEGGPNRCARIHAGAAGPHCRLTVNLPEDATRHGEWDYFITFQSINCVRGMMGWGFWDVSLCFSQQSGRRLMRVLSILEAVFLTHTHAHTTVSAVWRVWFFCALLWRWKDSTPSGPSEQRRDAQRELTGTKWSLHFHEMYSVTYDESEVTKQWMHLSVAGVTVNFSHHLIHN